MTTRPRGTDRSRLGLRDLLSEALAGLLQRPARSVLTALGTVLGTGTFVCILGLTATAASQIDDRFNALTATEITVEDATGSDGQIRQQPFPEDAGQRVARLNGVQNAGVYWNVRGPHGGRLPVRSTPIGRVSEEDVGVVAAAPGALEAAEPTVSEGRVYDRFHEERRQPVAVLSSSLASRLGITTLETQPAVFIGDQPFTVIGIISDLKRKTDLLSSVVVPRSVAEQLWGPPVRDPAEMIISTDLGAARQVASETALALDPAHPDNFKVTPPPDPQRLRSTVTSDLNQLFLLLAAICLVIGAVGIANTTLVAVLERTGEIGLRRALGAQTRHITIQFLTESGVLGVLGGLVGSTVGVLAVLTVAVARTWTPSIHPLTIAAAPAIGLVTGLVAGLYPAWRASRIPPAEALRR
ncbi:ABC transporter permease [Streptomyces melanogenes]|uniref:ABC transporter permease n=1 Tax=Streptomyces melanogenes TaxID=67326 RepID=UPI0037BC5D75